MGRALISAMGEGERRTGALREGEEMGRCSPEEDKILQRHQERCLIVFKSGENHRDEV